MSNFSEEWRTVISSAIEICVNHYDNEENKRETKRQGHRHFHINILTQQKENTPRHQKNITSLHICDSSGEMSYKQLVKWEIRKYCYMYTSYKLSYELGYWKWKC